ncbi:MAG TPA: efflux RND transporter permease subunit [bacterium]|nr:efflux RND transporter permease subunit [bacterium]
MFLSNASVRRPIAMGCLIIALSLLGINSYRKMNLELMPKVDVPYITITTVYPGASPKEIETDIAKRIEDQMVTIDGLKHINSACMENACQTFLEFHLEVDVDIAATDVREKLDLIRSDFPEGVEDPKILKFDLNAAPIIQLALTGDASIDDLYDYADNTLRDRITVLPGVADVQLIGGAEREVHVSLDRRELAARGLSSTDVVGAIQQGIRTIPSGRIREKGVEYAVKFDADYDRVEDIGELEVASKEGQRCYIKDIGRVHMTTEELRQKADINGRPCVAIKVVKKADANAVRVVNMVREAMDELKQQLPGGMELVWVTDTGRFIESTVDSAWLNVGEGILLTALILFLFLYNLRALLVVSITMPLTIVIGLFFMQALGYTLNAPTLMAMGMSVGILVTNSIVVLEAIIKRLDETGDVRKSACVGASTAFIAVLASAGTNIVVLFPIAIMGGMMGIFIKFFAVTMLIMTAVSLFISFTLTPLLCSVILRARVSSSQSLLAKMEGGWNKGFVRVINGYRAVLAFTERRRWAAISFMVVVALALLQSIAMIPRLGMGFMSEPDQGTIIVKLEFPTHNDLGKTALQLRQAEELLRDVPEVRHSLSTIGKVEGAMGQATEGVHLTQILLKFSDRDERKITIGELMEEVRTRLADMPDCIVSLSIPSPVGGQSSDIELEIAGENLDTLDDLALKVKGLARQIGGVTDLDTTVRIGKPELRIEPKRAVLSDIGLPAASLGMAMRANLEGITAGTFKQGARNYDIVVELEEEEGKEQVQQFLFPGVPGHPLLLTSLGQIEESLSPVQITRKDKRRVSKTFANLLHGKPMGTAVSQIGEKIDDANIIPPGYGYTFAGMYEVMAEGQAGLAEAAIIAAMLVILTLSAILESFKQPIVIIVTLPLTIIGIIWALFITGKSIEIFVLVGAVMLIGIVVNNAILIIDQFNVHLREGVPRHKAMIGAACERFRPIVMITLAAVLGMLPMAFGTGIGAEMRNAIGIASAGGILVSGILTVLVLPIIYDLFTRRGKTTKQRSTNGAGE